MPLCFFRINQYLQPQWSPPPIHPGSKCTSSPTKDETIAFCSEVLILVLPSPDKFFGRGKRREFAAAHHRGGRSVSCYRRRREWDGAQKPCQPICWFARWKREKEEEKSKSRWTRCSKHPAGHLHGQVSPQYCGDTEGNFFSSFSDRSSIIFVGSILMMNLLQK